MDQVLQQLRIDRIFSVPYHPWSNGKLESLPQIPETHIEEAL